ncbi:MAG: HDOD domain-containing protein [Gammaproteobacteria bacterium]
MHATKLQNSNETPDRTAALNTVRTLLPLRYLSDQEFARISTATMVESCPAGKELFRSGRDEHYIFYLLHGDIEIASASGDKFKLFGSSLEARRPLASHPRDRIVAVTTTPVAFLRFPSDLMKLHAQEEDNAVTINELTEDDETIDDKVMFDVCHAVMTNDIVLPSVPDVALKIREVANNPDASVEDVARIIRADASTTAYCISIANSAAKRGVSKVDNVLDAVIRLGIGPTRDLVVAYTVRSLFSGTSTAAKKLMHEAWQHSCRIAALSYILARDVGRLNPERALLAGLLHDIGVTVLIKESQSHKVLIDDPVLFDRLCHELSGQIGAMVLRAWKFPDVFVTAALEAEFFGKPTVDRIQLSDVVMLAHLHDRDPAPWSLATENLADLSIHSKLGAHDLTEDCRLAVIEEAEHELDELTGLLGA